MKRIKFFLLFFIVILITSCSKDEKDISYIKETRQDLEMVTAYREAYKAINEGDPYFAAKKFLEAELLFPQSEWAPRSALMASYSYYQQNFYLKALENLERFLITYPNSSDLVYAHYLIGMCYYETIVDEKRDSNSIIQAKKKFGFVVNNYPNTDFALDSQFKIDLI